MVCSQDQFFDRASDRCEPCSRLCFQAAIQNTVSACRQLCGAYMKAQELEHSSNLHFSYLWLKILVPVLGAVVIAAILVYLFVHRKWRPQWWQQRSFPTQDSNPTNQGLLATATEHSRPTQDTEIIERVPVGQAPIDDDPPVYSPTPSGRNTASGQSLPLEILTSGNGSDRHPRDHAIV